MKKRTIALKDHLHHFQVSAPLVKRIALVRLYYAIGMLGVAKYQKRLFWKLKEEIKRTEKNLIELKHLYLRLNKNLKRTSKN